MKPKIGERVVIYQKYHRGRSRTTWFDAEVINVATYVEADDEGNLGFTLQCKFAVGRAWYGAKKYEISWFSCSQLIAVVDDQEKIDKEIRNLERMTGL